MRSYSRGTDSGLRERERGNVCEFGFTVSSKIFTVGSKIVNRWWFCFSVTYTAILHFYSGKTPRGLSTITRILKAWGAHREIVHAQTISI